jgi:integrase
VAYPTQTGHLHATQRTWEGEYAIYPHGMRVKKLVYLGMLDKVSRAEAQIKLTKHLRHMDLRRPVQDRPISTAAALKVLRAAGHRIGLTFFSARMLRHSYATHLWENGADIMVIQELLGHNWLNSTQVYVCVANRTVAKTFRHSHPRGR